MRACFSPAVRFRQFERFALSIRFSRTMADHRAPWPRLRRLNYQHLLYFWSVVRTGSLTRACEELALSAPTVSAQLRTLEERLGEKLLTKSGRKLVPTEVGRDGLSLCAGNIRPRTRTGRGARASPLAAAAAPRRRHRRRGAEGDRAATAGTRAAPEATGSLICREGTLERLVADLAVHELDVVLSDAPVTPTLNVRAYSHALGSCGVCWMATPAIAKSLRRGFPRSLDGVPMLLPTDDTAIRRALDQWLDAGRASARRR